MKMNVLHTSKKEGIFRVENGETYYGKTLHAFIHNLHYFIADIKVYSDGMIDCWGLIDVDGFKKKINEGWVVTKLPKDAEVSFYFLGSTQINSQLVNIEEDQFVREVEDIIKELNGQDTSSAVCQKTYYMYLEDPCEENKQTLKISYENVPAHNRVYILGDQDNKDNAIRKIIY